MPNTMIKTQANLKKKQVTRKKKVDWSQVARDYAEPMGGISQKIDQLLYR